MIKDLAVDYRYGNGAKYFCRTDSQTLKRLLWSIQLVNSVTKSDMLAS